MMQKSFVHLYFGDGKGKTTAAVGLGLRAYGRNQKVLLVQFLKDYDSGEIIALENHKIVAMCGGMHHSLTLSSTGVMYTFGRGDSGQLGSSEIPCKRAGDYHSLPIHPTLPSNDIVIKQINCGGNHNLALTDKNELYTWGYGDMLALGHGEEKDEPLPKKLNFAKGKIKNIKIIQVSIQ